MVRNCLKDLFQPLISRLCKEKGSIKEQGIYLWWFLQNNRLNISCKNHLWEGKKKIGSLKSHLGILDDEFEELLAAEKLGKFRSWYKKMGMFVQTYRYHSITWIDFDVELAPL